MQVKLGVLVLIGTAAILEISEALLHPVGVSCCTEVSNKVNSRLLRNTHSCYIQKEDDLCSIGAVVLKVRDRTLCADPSNKLLMKWAKSSCGENSRVIRKIKRRRRHMKNSA